MSTRQPFRLFADFTGADPRFREAVDCAGLMCHGPECPSCYPQLAMDEVPFAPPETYLPAKRPTADDLGFVDRASVPVSAMRRSIHRSHRGEGRNFVD